ncbi:hypothetical protein NW762_000281 [Fusarium torreyae]|uniref:Uncharacterized protein n=1 Tax=Fusarium torreyae TaxID=1237075 RepID=A0A9W8SJ42_9HYPO|nr:hypothetical protein NW762_000281 [Fusarium torreyae]
MAPRDKSRLAKRSGPNLFSSSQRGTSSPKEKKNSTAPKEKKDLSTMKQLYIELGLAGEEDSDKYELKSFQEAFRNHVNDYIRREELGRETLAEWKNESCQAAFRNMSKTFLVQEGPKYWPLKVNPTNTEGLTHLVKKLFFLYATNKRRAAERRSKQGLPIEPDAATKIENLKNNGHDHETAIVVDDLEETELDFYQQSTSPEPKEEEHPIVPDLRSSDSPPVNASSSPPTLPAANSHLTYSYRPSPVEDSPDKAFAPTENCPSGERADTEPADDSNTEETIHVAPATDVTTNEHSKRPAEAELDEAQRKTKSPRKEQDNTYAPETYYYYNNNNDDDDSSFQGSEEGLYTSLLGRQRRRTRQRDYDFDDLANYGLRSTPGLSSRFGRFGTAEPAVSVKQALELVDRRLVGAPVAPMMDEAAMATIEEQDEDVHRPSPRTSVALTQEDNGGFMPDEDIGMSPEQDESFPTPHGQVTATSELEGDTGAPSIQDMPNATLPKESATSSEFEGDAEVNLKSSGEASPTAPEFKVLPSPEETPPQEEPDYTKARPQKKASASKESIQHALAVHPVGPTAYPASRMMFSFIVYENDVHVDSWEFSQLDFFQISLRKFVKVLPIQDKALLKGLTICQNGQKACMRQVYLYNEAKFNNIRGEFLSHIQKDLTMAKEDGSRLDYEISIKPIRQDMAVQV